MQLQVQATAGASAFSLKDPVVVLAGFTGRDTQAVARHIEELQEAGVAAPEHVPEFYRVPGYLLVPPGQWEVWGPHTSGEAEPVLVVRADGQWFLGVGSDHTDREQERRSIALAKQLGPKVLGQALWPWEEVAAAWDELRLESTADGELYQSSPLQALLPPTALPWRTWQQADRDLVVFLGTVPTLGGLRSHRAFHVRLSDPRRRRSLEVSYQVRVLAGP